MSSLLLPSLSPTTKAADEPASAPNSEELTIRPDWKELILYLHHMMPVTAGAEGDMLFSIATLQVSGVTGASLNRAMTEVTMSRLRQRLQSSSMHERFAGTWLTCHDVPLVAALFKDTKAPDVAPMSYPVSIEQQSGSVHSQMIFCCTDNFYKPKQMTCNLLATACAGNLPKSKPPRAGKMKSRNVMSLSTGGCSPAPFPELICSPIRLPCFQLRAPRPVADTHPQAMADSSGQQHYQRFGRPLLGIQL